MADEGPRRAFDGRLVEGSLEDAAAAQVIVGETPDALEAGPSPGGRGSARRERWRLLLRSPTFVIGAVVVLFWLACAIFPHLLERYDPLQTNILQKFKPPSGAHWFGTDDLGRDVYARVIAGARDDPDRSRRSRRCSGPWPARRSACSPAIRGAGWTRA